MPKYSRACNFYYGVKVYSFVPARLGRGLTSSSIIRFGGGRSLSTLKLASSTIEAKGVFLCEVLLGVLLLDLAAEGTFVLWNLQLLQ